MTFDWTSFLIGLLVGWLGEWVIDYFFWRRGGAPPEQLDEIKAQLNRAEARANELQVALSDAQADRDGWHSQYDVLRADLDRCRASSAALAAELAELRSGAATRAAAIDISAPADDLTIIEGIGPVYDQALREAGIVNFAQLAAMDPERLAVVIGAPPWRRVDYASWIAQAKLAAAGDEARLKALQARLNSRTGDDLTLIYGLGDAYESALRGGGINTFAGLAASSPAELEAIVVAAGLRRADFEAWIEEAKLRAAGKRVAHHKREYKEVQMVSCPQDLEAIDGVGVVYEQRLYEAGVGTYWEVSQLGDPVLIEILEVKPFQDVDLAAIRASAMALARETGTMHRVWDGTEPDDFEPITGIGTVYERRLYSAGFCSYAALAAASLEELESACQPPKGSKPDYAGWKAEAARLAAAKGVAG